MTTHTIPAAWLHENYLGALHARVKVHENANGEFFNDVLFIWTDPAHGANTKFALVAKSASGDAPFMFALSSAITATRLYDLDPPTVEFATGDLLDIEGVGLFKINDGGFLSHGVKLSAADCPCCDGAYNGLDH